MNLEINSDALFTVYVVKIIHILTHRLRHISTTSDVAYQDLSSLL